MVASPVTQFCRSLSWRKTNCGVADIENSNWHSTRYGRSVHQSPFWKSIVTDCEMHRGCVVPHQEIADLPFVPVLKLRPQAVRMQFLDQPDTLVVRQPFQSNTLASGDAERLAARPSMGP